MATPLTPTQLLATFKAEGIVVREYPGWRDRCRCHTGSHEKGEGWAGRGWGTLNGQVTHITAGDLGTRTVEQYIASAILGDPEIPCKVQAVIAPNGELWLVSAGRCNHAGLVGGAVQDHMRAADFSTSDNYDDRFRGGTADGNAFTFGYENITSKTMTAAQYETSVKGNAALARKFGWTGQESVGHGEISSARYYVDPGLDMGKFRRDVMARVKAGSTTGSTTPTPAPAPAPVEPTPAPAPEPIPEPVETVQLEVLLLPTAGYNASTAKGVTAWRSNTKGLAALVNQHMPDLVGTTELSNRAIDPMRPLFDSLLPLFAREPGGSDGRYVYRRKSTTTHIASGHVNVSAASELNGDDKQAAWSVIEFGGTRKGIIAMHTENEDGIDKTSGINADDLRVDQAFSALGRALTAMAPYGVTADDVIYVGDFNSESQVKNAMVAKGWKAIGPGWFTRWDDSAKTPCDWGFIKAGSATFERINHAFSDHTALRIAWTTPK